MWRVLRFGLGRNVYEFADTVATFSDSFGDVVPHTVRLPGSSGGLDGYGLDAAPSAVGKVECEFWLHAETDAEMQQKRDAVRAMAGWGKGLLRVRTEDGQERFTWARVNFINMQQRANAPVSRHQRVKVIFQVSAPRWYAEGTEAPLWGGGESWGGGAKWGGEATIQAVSGGEVTFTVTNSGNGTALPRITVYTDSGETAHGVTLQRIVDGVDVADEVAYPGTLGDGDTLEVDCRAASVKVNGADAYAGLTYQEPDWFTLAHGANTIKVITGQAGDVCRVALRWYDTWR
jgi:hypothetical protein